MISKIIKMKNNKHKIAVFSDLNESIDNTLKSAVNLAEMVNGEIELFHVSKASTIVNNESQLSAIREINSDFINIDNKMKKIVNDFTNESGVRILYSHAIGNPKLEIGNYIKENKPDIIVLRKKKPILSGLLSNNITKFVLENHSGSVFIANDNMVLDINKKLSLAYLNEGEEMHKIDFEDLLFSYSAGPLKSFKIVTDSAYKSSPRTYKGKKATEYIFEKRDNTIESLSNYISLCNVNLLCLGRDSNSTIADLIGNLNIPLFIASKAKQPLTT
jgi:hypothetical protein